MANTKHGKKYLPAATVPDPAIANVQLKGINLNFNADTGTYFGTAYRVDTGAKVVINGLSKTDHDAMVATES